MGINGQTGDVVEFGCGYGTFAIPAAKIIHGRVFALDIDAEMTRATKEKADVENLDNVETILRDFISDGSGPGDESVDYAMLFNILNLEKPQKLLNGANRILKIGGKMGIIHCNYNPSTPRGP